MDNFFRVPSKIYRTLKWPKSWLYIEICSRINYGEPHLQLGIECGHGQCAIIRTFLAYKYCRDKHHLPHACKACKDLVSWHLKRMGDVIELETVGSGSNRRYRITLLHHGYPEKSDKQSDKQSDKNPVVKPVVRQQDKKAQEEEFPPMNLPSSPIPVLDFKELDYGVNKKPLCIDITCEVLTAMGRQSIKKQDFKAAFQLVKYWISVYELSHQELLTITEQTISTEPIKKSAIGWMETVLHIMVEDAVSHKMEREKSRVKAKERAKEVKRAKKAPPIKPHQLDAEQVRANKAGWATLSSALRHTKGGKADDPNKEDR